jgi:hypothetical protein
MYENKIPDTIANDDGTNHGNTDNGKTDTLTYFVSHSVAYLDAYRFTHHVTNRNSFV